MEIPCPNSDCSKPMIFFTHKSGVTIKVKPNGSVSSEALGPHSSIFLVEDSQKFQESFDVIKKTSDPGKMRGFVRAHLDVDHELAKVDPISGKIVPKTLSMINVKGMTAQAAYYFRNALMKIIHPQYNFTYVLKKK